MKTLDLEPDEFVFLNGLLNAQGLNIPIITVAVAARLQAKVNNIANAHAQAIAQPPAKIERT